MALDCATALRTLLDQVDYTADPPACRVNEMIGAVLPKEVIGLCRDALADLVLSRPEAALIEMLRGVVALKATILEVGVPTAPALAEVLNLILNSAARAQLKAQD